MWLICIFLGLMFTESSYGQLGGLVTLWRIAPLYSLPYGSSLIRHDTIPNIRQDLLYNGLGLVPTYSKEDLANVRTVLEYRTTDNTTEEVTDETQPTNMTMNTTEPPVSDRPPLPPPPRPPPPPLPKPPPLPPPPPPRPSPYFQPPLPLPPPPPPPKQQSLLLRPLSPPPPPPPPPSMSQPSQAQPLQRPSGPPSYLPYLQPVFYVQVNKLRAISYRL